MAEVSFGGGTREGSVPIHIDHGTAQLCMPYAEFAGVFIASDSMVVTRTVQGRWRPRTPWLSAFVSATNNVVHALSTHRFWCTEHEGWWICHRPRLENGWSDSVAKWARMQMHPLTAWVHDRSLWEGWRALPSTGSWYISVDGSCVPEPPFARGLSGASCTLWSATGGFWWPVATLAASSQWAAAVEAEATALVLALAVCQLSTNVLMHEVLAVAGASWFTTESLRSVVADPCYSGVSNFCALTATRVPDLSQCV